MNKGLDPMEHMLWIDMETTGLDARDEVPLELGLAITNLDGEWIDGEAWFVLDDNPFWRMRVTRAKNHPIVGPMHEKSGLWADLRAAGDDIQMKGSIEEVDQYAAHWVHEHGASELPLTGSSIGSLDRPFVLEHFPLLNEVVHYRNIDVSTIKELCRRYNPELYENLTASWEAGDRKESHRVLDDIQDSVREFIGYRDNFLLWRD